MIRVLESLEKERLFFFKELEGIPYEKLNKKTNGNWSINEHLYHTWLAETSSEKYIRTKTKYPDFIKEMSPLVHLSSVCLRLLLSLGVKVKAPLTTTTFPKKIDLIKLNKKWKESRESFKNLMGELKEKKLDQKAVFRHPLMGRINLKLTLYFFNFHFKHHQKAINNLKK
tara:strand:+ start:2557 stop:3066 length:510 start_codon:yes stop_codon:yes gene_type:complete